MHVFANRSGQHRLWVACAAGALGALPASATFLTYTTTLNGANEAPPNASPGTGFATVTVDTFTHMMHVTATFGDLLGPTTAAHIHAGTAVPGVGTAPVATQTPSFIGFPLGVTAGFFDNTYDMSLASSYRAAFITDHGGTVPSAEAFFYSSLAAGTAYFNIHTSFVPGGEIRGFLALAPTPGGAALFGVSAFAGLRRRRA